MATMRPRGTAAAVASVTISEKDLKGMIKTATTKFDLKETVKEQNASSRQRSDSTAAAAASAKNRYAAIDLAKLEQKAADGVVDGDLLTVVQKRRE